MEALWLELMDMTRLCFEKLLLHLLVWQTMWERKRRE